MITKMVGTKIQSGAWQTVILCFPVLALLVLRAGQLLAVPCYALWTLSSSSGLH